MKIGKMEKSGICVIGLMGEAAEARMLMADTLMREACSRTILIVSSDNPLFPAPPTLPNPEPFIIKAVERPWQQPQTRAERRKQNRRSK